jgi:hypothetical protein
LFSPKYSAFQKAKIHKNIGVRNNNHTPNHSDFQNFLANLNGNINMKTRFTNIAIREATPKIQFMEFFIIIAKDPSLAQIR